MGQTQARVTVINPIEIKPRDIDPLPSGGQEDTQPPTASPIPGVNCTGTADDASRDAGWTAS
jgi:hypothetical protein